MTQLTIMGCTECLRKLAAGEVRTFSPAYEKLFVVDTEKGLTYCKKCLEEKHNAD